MELRGHLCRDYESFSFSLETGAVVTYITLINIICHGGVVHRDFRRCLNRAWPKKVDNTSFKSKKKTESIVDQMVDYMNVF